MRVHPIWIGIAAFLTLIVLVASADRVAWWWRYSSPPREVSADASLFFLNKDENGWASCVGVGLEARCRFFDSEGHLFSEEPFLAFDRKPVPSSVLFVDGTRTRLPYVYLRSGRLLLPKENFEGHRGVAEQMLGTAGTQEGGGHAQ